MVMRKLSKEYNLLNPLKIGEIVKGKVITQEQGSLFVDLGPQGTGIIRGKEFIEAKEEIKDLTPGKTIFAKVIELETEDGYVELSFKEAQKEALWQELEKKKENQEVLKVKILGANKGGLLATIDKISAFLPVSQLSPQHYPKVEEGDPQKILKALQKFIGKELEVNILSLNPKENQIILSEKLKETEKRKKILEKYQEGDIVEGEITGICDFGAFMRFPPLPQNSKDKSLSPQKISNDKKIEAIEGLIHISELDWQLVENPREIVKIGEIIKAKILQIKGEKVFLSLKALKENPWKEIEKKIKKGDLVRGKVKKLTPYGALVEVLPKIQGLCHISEFGSQKKMEEALKMDKTYTFKVLLIKPKECKITLQLVKDEKEK